MNITFNIYYKSNNDQAKKFAEEMISSGIVAEIKSKRGNLRYDFFYPIIALRNKYDLHMTVEKYIRTEDNMEKNNNFIRK